MAKILKTQPSAITKKCKNGFIPDFPEYRISNNKELCKNITYKGKRYYIRLYFGSITDEPFLTITKEGERGFSYVETVEKKQYVRKQWATLQRLSEKIDKEYLEKILKVIAH